MADLTLKNGIKFYVNTSSSPNPKTLNDSRTVGVVVFNEPTNEIYVNGIKYGISSSDINNILNLIGDLSDLNTADEQTSLVDAINEVITAIAQAKNEIDEKSTVTWDYIV